MKTISKLLIPLIVVSAISANAALYDRGNGMIYDSSLNITWLQDANYAQTSGYDADGFMHWHEATDWAENFIYGGYSDWRLSSAGIIGNISYSTNGSTDYGYNNTRSEIGHLFWELGNTAYCLHFGWCHSPGQTTGYGFNNKTFVDSSTNQIVSFLNVQNYAYWQAEPYAPSPAAAWFFNPFDGIQSYEYKGYGGYAWAVRDGDVTAVPVPAAAWLMGSALVGLISLKRKSR